MSLGLVEVAAIYDKYNKLNKEDVASLSEWVKCQNHLPELKELHLILFLQTCNYQLNTAKITIEKYFVFQNNVDLFHNITKKEVDRVLSSFFVAFLPKRTPNDDAVLLIKTLDTAPEKYNCGEIIRVIFVTMTLYFQHTGPANGLVIIFDTKGTTFKHFLKTNISRVKQMIYYVQEAAPIKFSGVHYINSSVIAEHLMALLKPFIKKDIYNMIKFHSRGIESLYKYVPRQCLPEDYGGLLSSIVYLHEKNRENIFNQWELLDWDKKN